jgi:hypothetical protein
MSGTRDGNVAWERAVAATMESLRALAYPATYVPAVAGPAGARNVLLIEAGSGPEGIAVRPLLLCQDWDARVVIHWEDDRGSYTYTVSDVLSDTAERFAFMRLSDENGAAERVDLTPLSYERYESEVRPRDPETGNIPRFESQEQFRRYFAAG